MKRTQLLVVALVLLLFSFVAGLPQKKLSWPTRSIRMGDIVDTEAIVSGLERTHSLAQTGKWWAGPWVAYRGTGQDNSFYRPLTSLIWYLEYHVWGSNGLVGFMLTHWLFHFGVCLLAVAFLRRLVGFKVAVLGVCLWCSCFLGYLALPSPGAALFFWKDGPDVWISGAAILCLWSLLSYWRTTQRGYLVAAIFCEILGITFKEMAYVIAPLAAALLWFEWQRAPFKLEKRHWMPVLALMAIVPVAYLYRTWALQGPGYRFGSNGSWLERWGANAIGGRPLYLVLGHQYAAATVSIIIVGVICLCWKKWWPGGVLIVVGTGLMFWSDSLSHEPFEALNGFLAFSISTPFYRLPMLLDTSLALLTIGFWFEMFHRRDPRQIFFYLWVILTYIPLMTAPITEHALYLPSVGWALATAVILQNQFRSIRELILRKRASKTPALVV